VDVLRLTAKGKNIKETNSGGIRRVSKLARVLADVALQALKRISFNKKEALPGK